MATKELFPKIIHYLLQIKPNMHMAQLHKLLYFLEFNFLERNEEELLEENFRKNYYGPTSDNLARHLYDLIDKGLISVGENNQGNSYYYSIKDKNYSFAKKVQEELDNIKKRYIDLSTTKIAALSHRDTPYVVTKPQAIINKQSVFFRNKEFSVFG